MSETDRILAVMAGQFMEPCFTRPMDWFVIDGTHGMTFLAFEDAPPAAIRAQEDLEDDEQQEALITALKDYYEGTAYSVDVLHGIGARLSAPGYMDCTEWSVFPTLEEAKEYIVEMYGDDIELDEEEE